MSQEEVKEGGAEAASSSTAANAELHISLLELQQQNGVAAQIYTRLCYVGRLAEGANERSVRQWHADALEAESTGVALVQGDTVAALVECSPDGATAFLQGLAGCALFRPSSVRVVCSVEACPSRSFSEWRCVPLKMPVEDGYELPLDQAAIESHALYAGLLGVGKRFQDSSMSPADREANWSNLAKFCPDSLPSNEKVLVFARSDGVQEVSEFLAMYDPAINAKADSDLVWPIASDAPF